MAARRDDGYIRKTIWYYNFRLGKSFYLKSIIIHEIHF